MKKRFYIIFCLFVGAIQSSAVNVYLDKEYLTSATITGNYTMLRSYYYNSNGFLSTIIDSPRVNNVSIPTYETYCDSIGRISKVIAYHTSSGNVPNVTTNYQWLTDHQVAFVSRNSDDVLIDTGIIQANGKIRIVRLPQIESQPSIMEQQLIVIVSDSTEIYTGGNLINTYYWQFDSNGTDTVWNYRKPGGKKEWVEGYTNVYDQDGILSRRFPALESPSSYYFYSSEPSVFVLVKKTDGRYRFTGSANASPLYRKAILLNGRLVPSSQGMQIGNTQMLINTGRCNLQMRR